MFVVTTGIYRQTAPKSRQITGCTSGIRIYPNTWLDTGLDAFVAGCEKNVTSAIYGIGCAYNFVAMNIATSGLGLIPAAYIIFKK